jgi:acyltransferase
MSELTAGGTKTERVNWVDVAKALGIFLVFYGHYVEKLAVLDQTAAEAQMNWIYSFHMPMFFLFVGLIYKRREMSTSDFLVRQIRGRLVPVWVFNLIGMVIWIVIEMANQPAQADLTTRWLAAWPECKTKLELVFIYGRPGFNVLTWFLICLFLVEVWQFLLKDRIRTIPRLLVSIAFFGGLAVLASLYYDLVEEQLGKRRVWWEFTPALLAMFFYQIGILCKETGVFAIKISNPARGALCLLCLAVSLAVFNQNQGLANFTQPRVPLMVEARYGEIWWFLPACLAGTGFIIYLSQLLAFSRFLTRLGSITLSLMLLDGIWHSFINLPAASWILRQFPDHDPTTMTIHCLIGTVASMAISWPVAVFLERYTPFLLGRAAARKPAVQEAPPNAQTA